MRRIWHRVDFCVVGGGMAGVCAAIAAARLGAKTAIVQDRPMFGGNSSSEIRMHICGADRSGALPNLRETGILEELRLEHLSRNPQESYSMWDAILYEKVIQEPNIQYLLNCSCLEARMDGPRIRSVSGWQLTTETLHTIEADVFADCSGDGVLAPLTGAEFRMGREARDEFGESLAPQVADEKTMGMSCMFAARDTGKPLKFEPPAWAYTFETDDDLPRGDKGHDWIRSGYWWIELGGEQHSIHDTEAVRDELLKIVFGVWDHIKNRGSHGAENWALDWIQFLPGKRESRRYVGDHILTQNDIEAEGRFDDIVAYGGWTMDDHDPAGFWAVKSGRPATIWHPCPTPYGIPYRCLYSRNISNLMFAGRCISASHVATSSTRVMGTAAVLGQAAGTAAAIAVTNNLSPREVGKKRIEQLQQTLLRQDCWLPWVKQQYSEVTRSARLSASSGDPQPLVDGVNRPVGEEEHCWTGRIGDNIEFRWDKPRHVSDVTLVFDSDLSTQIVLSHCYDLRRHRQIPDRIVRSFRIEVIDENSGNWRPIRQVRNNRRRLFRHRVDLKLTGLRVVFEETWGSNEVRVQAFYVD